jgi:hypothetical protein
LLELGAERRDADGLALEVLRRLEVGLRENDDGCRVAPKDRADRADIHALGLAEPDDIAVNESEL